MTNRDSSGSEVTLGDDSLTAYVEPFGKAANTHKNTCNRPDSIASAVDSELDAMLSTEPVFSRQQQQRKSCPVHKPKIISIPADNSQVHVQVAKAPKQLKGILKASKSNTIITSNPVSDHHRDSSSNSCSPPPLMNAETVHISKAVVPKPPVRTSSNNNTVKSSSVSEALHV